MDNVTPTVSFDQTIIDELFQLSPLPISHHQMIDDQAGDLMMILAASPDPQVKNFPVVFPDYGSTEQLRNMSSVGSNKQNLSSCVETKKRRIVHRDVERQRRHQMTLLYRTLRSRLPLEVLKGKRSTCDHIHEAVRYIEHLANKIRGLNVKKDELKRLSLRSDNADTTSINTPLKVLTQIDSTMKVNMNQWLAGLEIDIDTDSRQGVSLSRVLGFLTHEGHAVVSCTSIRVNERLLLSIKSEVTEHHGRSVELSELQQRLMNFITYY